MIRSVAEFDDWLSVAKRGDRAVYYEGFLLRERLGRPTPRPDKDTAHSPVMVALRVWGMQLSRRVIIFQRRLGVANFQYIVQKI
jgi:hypothetical protein